MSRMSRWLYSVLHLLFEANSARRDARVRFLRAQVNILRRKLGGNRVCHKSLGRELTESEQEAIEGLIESDAVSPAFVRRVMTEYGGDAAIKAAYRLPVDAPDYWLDCLLRSRKGHFYRRRYPTLSVV